jgi:hypothetical protein
MNYRHRTVATFFYFFLVPIGVLPWSSTIESATRNYRNLLMFRYQSAGMMARTLFLGLILGLGSTL